MNRPSASRPSYGSLPTPGSRPGGNVARPNPGVVNRPNPGINRPNPGDQPAGNISPATSPNRPATGVSAGRSAVAKRFEQLPRYTGYRWYEPARRSGRHCRRIAGWRMRRRGQFLHDHPVDVARATRDGRYRQQSAGDTAWRTVAAEFNARSSRRRHRPGEGGGGFARIGREKAVDVRPDRPNRPGEGGAGENRPGRPPATTTVRCRPGDNTRPGQGGAGEQWKPGDWANHRPDRIPDRDRWNNWRNDNRDEHRQQLAQQLARSQPLVQPRLVEPFRSLATNTIPASTIGAGPRGPA